MPEECPRRHASTRRPGAWSRGNHERSPFPECHATGARGTRSFSQSERRTSCGRWQRSADRARGGVLTRPTTRVLTSVSHRQGSLRQRRPWGEGRLTSRHRAHARTIAPPSATEHVSLETYSRSAPVPGPAAHQGPGRSPVPREPVGSRSTHRRRGLLWSASLDGRRRRSRSSHQQPGDLLRATSGWPPDSAPAPSAPSCPTCTAESSTSGSASLVKRFT